MNPQDMDWRELFLRLVFTSLLLGLAMLVPFVLLDSYYAGFAAFIIGGAYMIVRVWLNERRRRNEKRRPHGFGWFLVLNGLTGELAGIGLAGIVILGWLRWAYAAKETGEYAASLAALREWPLDWPLALLLASVAVSGFSLLFVKQTADGAPGDGQRARNYGLAAVYGIWTGSFAGVALLLASLQFIGPPVAMEIILDAIAAGRDRAFADLLLAFPVVTLSIFTSAMLFVVFSIDLWDEDEAKALGMGNVERVSIAPGANETGQRVVTAMRLGGYVASLALATYMVHVTIVLAVGSAQALLTAASIGGDLDEWVTEQVSEARAESDIVVARINKLGYWSPTEPDAGTAELIPGHFEDLEELGLNESCRVTIQAEKTDHAGQELNQRPEHGNTGLAEPNGRLGESERPRKRESEILRKGNVPRSNYVGRATSNIAVVEPPQMEAGLELTVLFRSLRRRPRHRRRLL